MTEEVKRLRCAVADLIGENEQLRKLILSCRCADCGDELGRDWSVNNGVAFCNYCAGGDEDDNV